MSIITKLRNRTALWRQRKYYKAKKPIIDKINEIEKSYQDLSDEALFKKTSEFRERHHRGETLDSLLPEAYAACKNASRRLCGKMLSLCNHKALWVLLFFDVQLLSGIALQENKIIEMGTGEGKTIVATLPLYLNSLSGENCHLVTANDYLVRRDAEWMGHLYGMLDTSVGNIQNGMGQAERKSMYSRNITYGTASEFGFDFLRDNMALRLEDQCQRGHNFTVIDEADMVLIDEACVPLIIAGPSAQKKNSCFEEWKVLVKKLVKQQEKMCRHLAAGLSELAETGNTKVTEENLVTMLQLKLGMPKNNVLLKVIKKSPVRQMFEEFQMRMQSEFFREEYIELKERLFYTIDERGRSADLSEKGRRFLSPSDPEAFTIPCIAELESGLDGIEEREKDWERKELFESYESAGNRIHAISQLLRAYTLYEQNNQYIVEKGKVVIVDANTGHKMPGRRWSDGLHQAIEAKENLTVQEETSTYGSITLQNYFRKYNKLAGMTGTAETEAGEFQEVYGLDVISIPANKPVQRIDCEDRVFLNQKDKFAAVAEEVKRVHRTGQPVLIGTESIDASEGLSRLLKSKNIGHSVLNAKRHEEESSIIAKAGFRGAVTVATNMAGRGTDIRLDEESVALGGLYVIGTERSHSRRVDRQLRGRSGRQGDPGRSRFFISMEDELFRVFDRSGMLTKAMARTLHNGSVELPPWVAENAQKRIEQQGYASRRQLLRYDNILNGQMTSVFEERQEILTAKSMDSLIAEYLQNHFSLLVARNDLKTINSIARRLDAPNFLNVVSQKEMREGIQHLSGEVLNAWARKTREVPADQLQTMLKEQLLRSIDHHWRTHLAEMETLKEEVSLAGFGQKDPVDEYTKWAHEYFNEMLSRVQSDIIEGLIVSIMAA